MTLRTETPSESACTRITNPGLVTVLVVAIAGAGGRPIAAQADEMFERPAVLTLALEIGPPQLAALREDHRAYVVATLREGAASHTVGVRLKGSAGSFRPVDADKPGFTIKVNQLARSRRFHGLRKFVLNNAAQDPSYLSEILGNEIFRRAGIPAARGAHAHVSLNGKDLGLYVLFEAVSQDFLARHFETGEGNLYEGPGDVDGDIDCDREGPHLEHRDLRMLANAAREPRPDRRFARLREVLDVDRFVTFLALEALLWHWDGYGVGVNNYRVYSNPATGRMVFLPHGSDQLFQTTDGPLAPELQGLVARAVMSTREGKSLYRATLSDLLHRVLDADWIKTRITTLSGIVQEALAARGDAGARDQARAAAGLQEQVLSRLRFARAELSSNAGIFGAPLEFDARGVARVTGWQPRIEEGTPDLDGGPESEWLRIRAVGGDCVASWRARVLLSPGRYAFVGRARFRAVVSLDRDEPEDGSPGGVSLRISRQRPRQKLTGSAESLEITHRFRVTSAGITLDPPPAGEALELQYTPAAEAEAVEVQLVCELEASSGELEVEVASLCVVREPLPSPRAPGEDEQR